MAKSKYDTVYSKNKHFFGKKPSLLIFNHLHLFPKNLDFLDLGCGQGHDLLFMNNLGYKCLGIDNSPIAIQQLQKKIVKCRLQNIIVKKDDALNFDFSKNRHDIINLRNILQYFKKGDSKKIILDTQKYLNKHGFIIISSFTTEDPSFHEKKSGFKSYFKKNELLKYFPSKFKIVYYYEGLIQDKGHGDYPPHQHGVVMLIAQKK